MTRAITHLDFLLRVRFKGLFFVVIRFNERFLFPMKQFVLEIHATHSFSNLNLITSPVMVIRMTNSDDLLPVTGQPVPVFDCHVIVTPDNGTGEVKLRCASLPQVTAAGPTERDALMQIVKRFKEFVRPYSEKSQPIPFSETPETPKPGESERWIPVHL